MKVFINGQSYDDWSQLPEPLKQQLAATLPDADHNGVPDVFEGKLTGLPTGLPTGAGQQSFVSTSINVNGQQYNSVDQLPPEVRETLQAVFGGQLGMTATGQATPGAPAPTGAPSPLPQIPGVPQANQVILNGQPVAVEPSQPKKGFFKRLFGK